MSRFPSLEGMPLIEVLTPRIQEKYHVAWAHSRGVVGICISIDEVNKTVMLKSPKTKIVWNKPVLIKDLRHTRENQNKIRLKLREQ